MAKTKKHMINMHIIPLNKHVSQLPLIKIILMLVRIRLSHGLVKVSLLLLLSLFPDDSNVEICWEQHKMANLKTKTTRKQSKPNFLKNENFLLHDTNTYAWVSGDQKYLFFQKFNKHCFLDHSILKFALLPCFHPITL